MSRARGVAIRIAASPWFVGVLLGLIDYARRWAEALRFPLQRYDEGIQLSAGWFVSQGEVPLRDFYHAYGVGFGFLGAVGQWLFGGTLLADRLVYMLAPAAVVTVGYVLLTRRSGWPFGLAFALLAMSSSIPRYAECWLAILGGLLVAQHAIRATEERTLRAGLAARPGLFLAAGLVMAPAAWVRGEYALVVAAWGLVVLFAGSGLPRRWRLSIAIAPLAVALFPYLVIALVGGLDEMLRWARYDAFGFREFRSKPIDLHAIRTWARAPFHGWYDREGAYLVLTYVAGTLLAALWVVHLAAKRFTGRGVLAPDPTYVAPFLSAIAIAVTYAQSVRFSAANGTAVVPIIWAAWLSLRWARRPRLMPAVVAVAGVLVVIPVLEPYLYTVDEIRTAHELDEAPERVASKLAHIPLSESEWPSMAGIYSLWADVGLRGRPVLATNKRNDLSYANGAYLYWYLDAPPAAWVSTYDPGLSDREDVQREAIADLCRNRAPVVEENQDPTVSSNGEYGPENHRSRRLDEFIALNYRTRASVGLYRLRLRDTGTCVQPEQPSDAAVRARREQALRADDLPQAAALSILLVERAQAAGRAAAPADVAGAVLGEYWVPDSQMPAGPARAGLVALRQRAPAPATAATAPGDPLTRLATTTAYLNHRPPDAPAEESAAVIAAMRALVRDAGRWPATVRNLFAMQPPNPRVFADVQRHGGAGAELERIRFAHLAEQGDDRAALQSGLRLLRMQAPRPLEQGAAFGDVAAVLDRLGDRGCAARARALGDGMPGVHLPGVRDPEAPCTLALPTPSLSTHTG